MASKPLVKKATLTMAILTSTLLLPSIAISGEKGANVGGILGAAAGAASMYGVAGPGGAALMGAGGVVGYELGRKLGDSIGDGIDNTIDKMRNYRANDGGSHNFMRDPGFGGNFNLGVGRN